MNSLARAIRQIAKRIPGLPNLYRALRALCIGQQGIFTDIYRGNKFGGKESVSGPGSDSSQTRVIIQELPSLFEELGISSILDIPCGDFHWMCRVNLDGVRYVGVDIVEELVQKNQAKFERNNIHFLHLNLTGDHLPKMDLVLCRDCLVHFSFRDIFKALHNICSSKSAYLLTTTFASRKDNSNIQTGQWRPLNLEIPPFCFPRPLKIINEQCTEGDGIYEDKSLGLWRIEDIVSAATDHTSKYRPPFKERLRSVLSWETLRL